MVSVGQDGFPPLPGTHIEVCRNRWLNEAAFVLITEDEGFLYTLLAVCGTVSLELMVSWELMVFGESMVSLERKISFRRFPENRKHLSYGRKVSAKWRKKDNV